MCVCVCVREQGQVCGPPLPCWGPGLCFTAEGSLLELSWEAILTNGAPFSKSRATFLRARGFPAASAYSAHMSHKRSFQSIRSQDAVCKLYSYGKSYTCFFFFLLLPKIQPPLGISNGILSSSVTFLNVFLLGVTVINILLRSGLQRRATKPVNDGARITKTSRV